MNRTERIPSILWLFNIRLQEKENVLFLFGHYFLQGFAMALLFTVANTLFLAHFPVNSLPVVYMVSAAAMLVTGRLYASLEHHLSLQKLMAPLLLTLATALLLFFLGIRLFNYPWMGIALMVGYRVVYQLSSLEFWGLSALLFDVRQSKRLFGLISGGDIPAKLLGYLCVAALVPWIGLPNLLLVAAAAFLLCLLITRRIMERGDFAPGPTSTPEPQSHPATAAGLMIRKIFKHPFIFILAGLSMVVMATATLIDFSFLSAVQETFRTETELARFISLFFSFGYGVTFLSKLFLSGRLIDQWGIRTSLLLLPGVLLTAAVAFLVAGLVTPSPNYLLGVFAILLLFSNTFRRVLHEPTFLSLFQPLSSHLRLHGHTVAKGLVEPIGLGLTGLLLYAMVNWFAGISLVVVTYILIAVVIGWLALVQAAYRQYVQQLVRAIQRRFVAGNSLIIKDRKALNLLYAKLSSPFPEEAIYAQEVLLQSDETLFKKGLGVCLRHPAPEVRRHALLKIEQDKIQGLNPALADLVEREKEPEIREIAIRVYCIMHEEDNGRALAFLEHRDPQVRKGAIAGLLRSGDIEAMVLAGQQLLQLIHADQPEDKVQAANLLGELRLTKFYKPITGFLQDRNPNLRKAAIVASGHIRNPLLLPLLLPGLADPGYIGVTLQAMARYGDAAAEHLEQVLQIQGAAEPEHLIHICRVCGLIRGDRSERLLKSLLAYPDVTVEDAALQALKRIKYRAKGADQQLIHRHLDHHLRQAYRNLSFLEQLHQDPETYALLIRALNQNFWNVRERLFTMLAFLYDPEKVVEVESALGSGQREKRAVALEMLGTLLERKLQLRLFPLLEEDLSHRQSRNLAPPNEPLPPGIPAIFEVILTEGSRSFSPWIQGVALHCLPSQPPMALLVRPYLNQTRPLLHQTAHTASVRLQPREVPHALKPADDSPNPPTPLTAMKTKAPAGTLMEIEKILILHRTSIFSETPEGVLIDLAAIVREERVQAGGVIFEMGSLGDCMYIIYEGEVRIHAGSQDLARLMNRDFFGELALLDPEPRSATATALTETFMLRLDQQAFSDLIDERPEIGKGILKVLCQRLRRQNQLIATLGGERQHEANL